MKRNIGYLLFFTILILLGTGSTAAQLDVVAESDEEPGIPLGTLLENSPPDNFPGPDRPDVGVDPERTLVIPESTKGFDEQKVKQDPFCDPTNRPTIVTVTPDEVRPGDTIIVTGNYFGAKTKCLYSVTFGEFPGENLTLLEDNAFRVRVPKELKAGLVFLNIVTNGGSARSAILVKG